MKYIFKILIFFTFNCAYAQMSDYTHTRELEGISEQWHKVILPDDIYTDIAPHLNDIRIFGITSNSDTIEAPYLLQQMTETLSSDKVNFKIINQSQNDKGYYTTFQPSDIQTINQIRLGFSERNFDHRIQLEGSHNQIEWFALLDDYRILSIRNELTKYQFTTLRFADAKYQYFRLFIPSNKQPGLHKADIALRKTIEGKYRNYTTQSVNITEDKKAKQTIIDLDLGQYVPVSYLKIAVQNDYDYYRPMTIRYLHDSLKTEKGWKYNYRSITAATLNSIEKNELKFDNTMLQKLQITIHNQDNAPLKIGDFVIKGYTNELTARFTETATYYLTYGNPKARKPQYDIARFSNKIPESLSELELGAAQKIDKTPTPKTTPLFENKAWLWAVMLVIIGLLGWFSIQMMRKK